MTRYLASRNVVQQLQSRTEVLADKIYHVRRPCSERSFVRTTNYKIQCVFGQTARAWSPGAKALANTALFCKKVTDTLRISIINPKIFNTY